MDDDDVSLPASSSSTDLDRAVLVGAAAEMVSGEDASPTGGRGGGGGAASQCALRGDDIEAPMVE